MTPDPERPVLALDGELDLGSAHELEHELDVLGATGGLTVVLDLSALRFMDSTGLRAILAANERLRADGARLALIRGPDPVHRVFEITGTAGLLSFVD